MSAEGRACRQSAGARGGAGAAAAAAAAAAREHTRGSEPRQPASPAPQRERPRRLARHLPPQCPQPSRGRAWTRLSKCGAPDPTPHGVHGLAPRGGRVARAASQKNPVRARSVPLAPSALRWAPPCSRVTPGILGEMLSGRERGFTLCGPLLATCNAPPKPLRARKFTREQAQGELRSAQVQSRTRSGLDSVPSSPLHLLSPLCPFGPRKGDVPSGGIPSPRRPLSRAAGGAAASRARDQEAEGAASIHLGARSGLRRL